MTCFIHSASYHNLTHETFIDMEQRVQVHKWCQKQFGRAWEPFTNPKGRWTMIWGGHDEDTQTLINDKLTKSKKYKVCFADEQDLLMFETTLGSSQTVDQ
jgi:hypothetical protein